MNEEGLLPEPFVDGDVDLHTLPGFMLNVHRLLFSELWALSNGEEFKAAVGLWCHAFQQIPAGSLPDDDRILAAFSGAGRKWNSVKQMALRGFVKCADGRLYHRVLCAEVKQANQRHISYKERREKDAERLRKWRETQDAETTHETMRETRFETVSSENETLLKRLETGKRQDRKRHKKELSPPIAPPFAAFWEAYPHKVGKAAALAKFVIALRKADLATLIAGIERYQRTKPRDHDWCNPATWLHQERWTDQPATSEGKTTGNGTYREEWNPPVPERRKPTAPPKIPGEIDY